MSEPIPLPVRVRKPLNLPTDRGADQAFKDETNINTIIAQYQATGSMTSVNHSAPLYGDVSEATDLADAFNKAAIARASFDELPSLVRAAALNDPIEFLAMANDPDGRLLLQDAGLSFSDEPTRSPFPSEPPAPAAPAAPAPAEPAAPTESEGTA